MEYNQIKEFSLYKDIHENKISQLRRPKKGQPLVVFFDGKSATKYHKFDMISKESFTLWMIRSMRSVLKDYQGVYELYGIIDEITIIFHDSEEIAQFLNEDCIDSIFSLLMSMFTLEFNKHISCTFKGAAYFINDIKREIAYRKSIGYYTALEYYAKEYMNYCYYHKKTEVEIIEALKQHNLYESFIENKAFRNGLYYKQK